MRGGVCWDMSSACVQGGLPRPLGGYQPMMEAHSPAPAWHMHHTVVPKQEPMEEEIRNDSGINSGGSDFHASSPGSDNSQEYNPSFSTPSAPTHPYYSTPVTTQYQRMPTNYPSSLPYLGFNPLTPPSSEPMMSPKVHQPIQIKTEVMEETTNTTLTPHASPNMSHEPKTPSSTDSGEHEDPLRRLQMSFEKNGYFPSAFSPKTSEHSNDEDNKSDGEEYDEEGLRIPKVNSHGKVKTFKCKQCDYVAITKLQFWEHTKAHIKTDKLLTCPKCPFVTEYKHHLEYHLRNHFGSKPFKCDKCNYSCVNKSMLNSHMKSHSNVYQYRCADCSYATKYCHSLKLHLRKYNHKPAMVLNLDGTPNPLPIIDVYGTRRGPKVKIQQSKTEEEIANNPQILNQFMMTPPQNKEESPQQQQQQQQQAQQQLMQNQLAQFMMNSNAPMQLPFPYPFLGGFPGAAFAGNPMFFPQMSQQLTERKSPDVSMEDVHEDVSPVSTQQTNGALDLSKPCGIEAPIKNRRKGRAFKLERVAINHYHSDAEDDSEVSPLEPEITLSEDFKAGEKKEDAVNNNAASAAAAASTNDDYTCQFCNIAFGDAVLYTMHMGYHGFKDPFTCNMCGEQCNDKVAFFLHIARNPHT